MIQLRVKSPPIVLSLHLSAGGCDHSCGVWCRSEFYAPCRTNKYPREIPELPWYRSAVPQMVMAGQPAALLKPLNSIVLSIEFG